MGNGRELELVLRLFDNPEWLKDEPDLAIHEASNLEQAARRGVIAPDLVALDDNGEFCGWPAVLMTRVPGQVELLPADRDDWLRQMAAALLPLHAEDLSGYEWQYEPYFSTGRLAAPSWSGRQELWRRAIALVKKPWPAFRPRFIHRDYHPNNLLWQEGRLSGIVDWANACCGPAGIDLAWCRRNLAYLYGVATADRFLWHYARLSGSEPAGQPIWDLLVILEELPGPLEVYPPWAQFGVQGLTPRRMLKRLEKYLDSVLARF